jgi:hypothetical protein
MAVIPLLVESAKSLGCTDEVERRAVEAVGRAEECGDWLHLSDLLGTRGLALNAMEKG